MSPSEIDALFGFLQAKADEGFFARCWSTAQEAAGLFKREEAAVQSMWSPAYGLLGAAAEHVRESDPAEGFRGWHGGLSVARHVSGPVLQMAYEYMDWWLSGWAGAVMARQGYYISAPAAAKPHLTPAEWAYWYDGREASEDLVGADGSTVAVSKGARRSGGGYLQRARRIALWNTVMDEHNYATRAWARFVAAVNGKSR
jgi:putative spermidine/putrescine transport system substrate-binding protein